MRKIDQIYTFRDSHSTKSKVLFPCDRLYFIIEGEFEVCKNVTFIQDENDARIEFKSLEISPEFKSIIGRDYEKLKILENKLSERHVPINQILAERKVSFVV